ncbi:MAG: deoxyribonuclease V [Nitrospirota bacterium]
MKIPQDTAEAKKIQLELRRKVRIAPLEREPEFIAGVDAAFSGDKVIAAACLYKYPDLVHVEDAFAIEDIPFPYIPGLLSFREGPAIIKAIRRLNKKPDLVIFDGQGIAHPAGMGIASHIGVLLDMPSIGCAKSRLIGDYDTPGISKGMTSELTYHNTVIGTVLRTRDNVRPLFISPGHMIDMKGAVDIVLACTGRYRVPEPIRSADALAGRIKKEIRI